MLFEEPDKVGNIFVTQQISNVLYGIGRGKQISFCFE